MPIGRRIEVIIHECEIIGFDVTIRAGISWVIMGDDIGWGLLSMAVCFDFCSTNVVQLSMLSKVA